MNLDDTQKKQVAAWLHAGLKLSEVQKRLETEFGVHLTYMEVRFLVDDLKLMPKDPEPPKTEAILPPPPAAPLKTAPEPLPETAVPPLPGGHVSVVLDSLARPGALVSGKVTFSDGQRATWYLDEMGRLGLQPDLAGYKPTAEDIKSFQMELQTQLQKMGF